MIPITVALIYMYTCLKWSPTGDIKRDAIDFTILVGAGIALMIPA